MKYKLYRYELDDRQGRIISPDRHYDLFQQSIGRDDTGRLAEYRGQRDTVLMYLRAYRKDFAGLIGRHSTRREVTTYDETVDEADTVLVDDDDYPNVPFICMPRLRMIACVKGRQISPDSAMSRLHQIIAHRTGATFIVEAIREPFDLRKAVKRFRVVEITFDILPVNPPTGDLGKELDESRSVDHIDRIVGKMFGDPSDPIVLDGGFATAVQELQASGHSRVGFKGLTSDGIEVDVPKPRQARSLSENSDETVVGENVDVEIVVPNTRLDYPFDQTHVLKIRKIAKAFSDVDDDD